VTQGSSHAPVASSLSEQIEQAGDNKGGVIAKNASKCSLCSTAMDILIAVGRGVGDKHNS